ncbi:MAG: response regulator [Melioribacteraceae bacterium]|nr:response regulator [Melioribacteraceae bacterium]
MTKIMIIEDDPAILIGLEELFAYENYEVTSVSDGKEGLEKSIIENPEVVILDVNLPNLNGFDVCRKLRENKFGNIIIMLTARAEQLDKIVGLEIGADDYLTKPFDSRELLARVRSQLRRLTDSANSLSNKNQLKNGKKRRLCTIMFTDMKDYSKKMNINEDLAIDLLKTHNSIMNETINQYSGRIVETIGDGYLVSFESALDAANCARELQIKFKKYNKTQSSEKQIEIRIGIHLGDVIEFENKLKGDTLNIAARIQQNSCPGGVHLSASVYDAIKNKVDFSIEVVGERLFKNIVHPITIYKIEV